MSLDPQVRAALEAIAALGNPPLHTLPAAAARKVQRMPPEISGQPESIYQVDERALPGPAGALPIRIYRPSAAPDLPLMVYFRGGGWTIGDLNYREAFCRRLANGADCIVVSVDYRNAPEHRFPAAVEDAWAATNWVAEQAVVLGGDPARLLVGGDSAGGNLAAVTAIQARDNGGPPLGGQLLIYPITDFYTPGTASYAENADGYFLTRELMIWFWHNYISSTEEALSPLASPLRTPDLGHLPPALVVTAEYDPLRDEGEAYARRLEQAGVATRLVRYAGQIHGFISMTGAVDAARHAVDEIAAAVGRMARG